mgnify:CR=1 FL=1|tara:strand:- start:578 stop:2134 length:1557 start_codon:yes stop_codon:yes gene_type:complete
MLQPVRPNRGRQAVSGIHNIPAPVGGLNARDALDSMDPSDALVMDNFFPEGNYTALRRGYASHGTGLGSGVVQTLMTYNALNGSEKMFGCANNVIYDATTAGAASSAYSTSITSNKWQWTNFTNTAGTYLLTVNGADTPLKYDGTTWSTNSLTGSISSSASIINLFQFKERLFFIQKNTLDLWYLASQAISGVLTKLPLGGVFENGGQIVAGGAFSFDAGTSIDNYLVVVTDNGEAAIYTGITPGSDFVLRGVYNVGVPVGNRCIVKIGGDLIIITTKGAVPLSQMINNDRSQADKVAITAKIQNLFNEATQNYSSNFGWMAISYPKSRWAVFNIPKVEGQVQTQFVQNVITGAWCRFTNMNANCWGMLNDNLYFGGNAGVVYKADTGRQDNGAQISWDLKTAFNACGSRGQNKFFKALRPLLLTSGTASFLAGINVDFDDTAPTGTVSATATTAALWGTGLWGTGLWGGLGLLVRKWLTVGRIGTTAAARFKGAADGISVQCNGFDVLYERSKGTVF